MLSAKKIKNKSFFKFKTKTPSMESTDSKRILMVLFLGVFIGSLDLGIVGPALPAIQSYFGVNERMSSWLFTIYILFLMIGTPLMAKLSDTYGRKTLYIVDVLLFAFGSIITIFAFSFEMLLIGRAIQGFGAGGIFPVANAVIGDNFPPEKQGNAMGITSSVWGLSGVLGPIFGGLLLKYSWQWLFVINIPLSIFIIIASIYILPKSEMVNGIHFDWKGLSVMGVLVACLAYGVNQVNTNNVLSSLSSADVLPFLFIAIVLLPVLWKVESSAKDPLIQIDLFKSKEVKLLGTFFIGTGLTQAATVFIPSFAVVALSLTTSNASLMVMPMALSMAIGAPIIGKLLDSLGSKIIMIAGTSILIIGLFMIGLFPESFYLFIIAGVLIGVGMATVIGSPPRYIMIVESPPRHRASGQALININSSAGQLIGGALLGAIIGSQAGKMGGYQSAFMIMGFIAIVMTLLTLGLKNRAEQLETMKKNFENHYE